MISGKIVKVERVTDRYKRIVGKVFYNGENINRKLVADGHCWVYRKYNKDSSMLELETQARANKLGLWRLHENERIPPWQFRKNKRKKK